MNSAIILDKITLEKFKKLPPEKQNMVKEFISFLFEKDCIEEKQISFLEDAKEFIGCVDGGPGDLATNKKYLEGLGQE